MIARVICGADVKTAFPRLTAEDPNPLCSKCGHTFLTHGVLPDGTVSCKQCSERVAGGFMACLIDDVVKEIKDMNVSFFRFVNLRKKMGIGNYQGDRSKTAFLSKALDILVHRGNLAFTSDKPGNHIYVVKKEKMV